MNRAAEPSGGPVIRSPEFISSRAVGFVVPAPRGRRIGRHTRGKISGRAPEQRSEFHFAEADVIALACERAQCGADRVEIEQCRTALGARFRVLEGGREAPSLLYAATQVDQ